MKARATNPYVDHLARQARLLEAAAAYCARHEAIAALTKEVAHVPMCTRPADDFGAYRDCTDQLVYPPNYEELEGQRKWWEYKPSEIPERDALLCTHCLERIRLWTERRALKAGTGGLKRAMLRAYRAITTTPEAAIGGRD